MLPALFTDDAAVLAAITVPWWFLVAQLPFAGIVFALDGVLLGAGDAAFMRTATVVSALAGFLPLTWLSLVYGWGWRASGRACHLHRAAADIRRMAGDECRWALTGTA
ncbi:DNA-damage-inducible F DinF domain protein [Mycobacterium ulcerans str. Harvey]|uniref:DNA-damage-inducible F DinF domain protein n=1 Tax=Mycobacterium ulcerans str. Harvey TaxID=1299332 RepID=A0ABP3AKR1_MYCUL|nr:DNA-damage-inducible F DinF domain protein [Mycobacterium ulcerans str. Harvey]